MGLRKINVQDAVAQWEYTTALPEDENGLTNQYVQHASDIAVFAQQSARHGIFLPQRPGNML